MAHAAGRVIPGSSGRIDGDSPTRWVHGYGFGVGHFPFDGRILGGVATSLRIRSDWRFFENKPKFYLADDSVQQSKATVQPAFNWVEGGRFMESTDTAKWNLNNLNHFTSQTTWLDLAESTGQAVQVDCTGTTGTCYAQYLWQTKALFPLRGKFVNVRLRMLAPSSLNTSQTVQVQFLLGSGANPTTTIAHSDSWQTITLSAWVPSTESALYLRIVPDTTQHLYWIHLCFRRLRDRGS